MCKDRSHNVKSSKKLGSPLDTLAQLRKIEPTNSVGNKPKPLETLQKRAKSKQFTHSLVVQLAKVEDSPLNKAYWNTYYCATSIKQEGQKLTSKYCKNRFCLVCNRIRTAQMIKGYLKPLEALQDSQFVTLTLPTIEADQLEARIEEMIKGFRKITDRARKQGIKLKGVRKLECTARPNNHFHPHFHIIVEGKVNAEYLLAQWLKEFPIAGKGGQDVREADGETIKEMMKYFTKLLPKKEEDLINPKALDIIFSAMIGKRVYQPFGGIKKVSEEIEEIQAEIIEDIEVKNDGYVWVQLGHDWYSLSNGEALSNYKPSEKDLKNIKRIIKLKNRKDGT